MPLIRRLHLKRYNQIISVLVRNGFGLLLEQLGIFNYLKIRRRPPDPDSAKAAENARKSIGQRLRCTCEELGPTFIKIGQVLSTRPDILSPQISGELEKLQEAVSPFPFDDVLKVIGEEFAEPLEAIFPWIDSQPLAAASLSQVHRARLPTGQTVVVKVQRPEIAAQIKVDLEILQDLVGFVSRHTRFGDLYDFKGMMFELERSLQNELDFRKEGENADRFRKSIASRKQVSVPVIRWIYTTSRVLTMEEVSGIRISQTAALDAAGINRHDLGVRLAQEMVSQILEDGFFHADPHPGNLWIQPDGTITFLDLGMVGHLSESRKRALSGLFVGMATRDSHQVVEAIVDLDTMQQRGSLRRFEHEVDGLLEEYMTQPIASIKIGELMARIFQLAFTYHVCIPGEMTLIAKVMITLQGILERLDPDVNLLVIMQPMASKLLLSSFSLQDIGRDLRRNLTDYRAFLRQAPTFLVELIHKMEADDYTLQFNLKNLDKVQKHLDRISNRLSISVVLLAVSLIIAGIIIGSSLSAGSSPELLHLHNVILQVGLGAAALIVIGLIVSMFRSKRF
jgi:ubiquinone biosynthesis protein